MSGDTLVYDMAQASEGSASIFVKKDWLNILDNQNGAYAANQSVVDTSQLANSNKYMNYREAYLGVPLLLTATGLGDQTNASYSADYAFGLKNWFGSIIHSMTLDLAGTTIIQQTPYSGLWNTFKLMTSLSWGDVTTIGSSIGFYPDNPLSFSFNDASANDGCGTCNNQNNMVFPVVSGANNSYDVANEGFLKRQQYINYDSAGLTAPSSSAFSALLTSSACANLYKSHISTKTSGGVFQVSIMAIIQLKHVHSFFQNVPLLKGVYMRMTLNLNQPVISGSYANSTDVFTAVTVSSPLGGVSPIMIASARASNGFAAVTTADATIRVSLAVGNTCLDSTQRAVSGVTTGAFSPNINLYVPAYTFNPVYEQAYLSSPVKRIVYTDIYQYQVTSVAAGATFNQLITNGIAGLKSVLVLPFYTAASNGSFVLDPIQSPFDPAGSGPTSPLCLLNNFNVVVSGQNMIYNSQKYSYEQFMNQLYGANAVNAGLTDGLTSGLFNQLGFEMEYCYHYVNCSRMLPVEEPVPKSVSIVGQNQSAKAIQLYVFCEYGVEIAIDVLTGARV